MSSDGKDVVVIGAGVIGAACAYELAKRGLGVVVVEQGRGPQGASVACDGFVFLQSKSPGPSLALAQRSRRLFDGLSEELGAELDFSPTGGLILARTEEEGAFLRDRTETLSAAGVEVQLLPGPAVREMEPHVTRQVVAASHCALDAQVDPLKLVHAYLARGRALGVDVMTQARVTGIDAGPGGYRLTCGGRTATARHVVIAAGAWSAEVGALLGLSIPVRPRRGQLVVTEPAPALLSRPVMTADYLMAKSAGGAAAQESPGVSIEQTCGGTLLLGSTREFVGFDTRTTRDALGSIVARASAVLPPVAKLAIIRSYAGLRPYCDLGRPIIGPVPGREGLFVATGHEGDGIALAPITGRLVAEWVMGRRPEGVDLGLGE